MEGHNGSEEINLAMIATYPELSRVLAEITKGMNIRLNNIFASFKEAAALAGEIEDKTDIILSRGGTAQYIKDAVSIPVISIPITPFDLASSISSLPEKYKEIAFLNYHRKLFGVRDIERMFSKRIREYTFANRTDIADAVKDAKEKGVEVVVGGDLGAHMATELGMVGVEIFSGREAVYQSLMEAMELIRVQRIERARHVRIKVAFDSIAEGIVIADENKAVTICNPAAERIFNLESGSAIGRNALELGFGSRIRETFESHRPEVNYLQNIFGNTININNLPIWMDGKFIGVVSTFEDITKIQNLESQIRKKLSEKGLRAKNGFSDILTVSPQMNMLKELAALYARTPSAVLIEGESGTGKELFAQSIHNGSQCSSGPFVAVNCAAIPEQLLESELFGYAPGAFTGAKREGKQGLFELAHNGTIFLDEIGEMPKCLQSRLLRVMQEKEVMRIGDDKIISVNCRIISATNKDLRKKVQQGEFREDLYYRLDVFHIQVPPLRRRKEDIPLLCKSFLEKLGIPVNQKSWPEIDALLESFQTYDWPGNVRELFNICQRIALLLQATTGNLEIRKVLRDIINVQFPEAEDVLPIRVNLEKGLKHAAVQAEKQIIQAMLDRYEGSQTAVMEKLGIGRTTLWRKLNDSDPPPCDGPCHQEQ